MFKIEPNPTFSTTVRISRPGEAKPGEFVVEFKHLTRDELKAYFSTLSGRDDNDALFEIIAGWSEIDIPFSKKGLATLLNKWPTAGHELFEAFRREALESKLKN